MHPTSPRGSPRLKTPTFGSLSRDDVVGEKFGGMKPNRQQQPQQSQILCEMKDIISLFLSQVTGKNGFRR